MHDRPRIRHGRCAQWRRYRDGEEPSVIAGYSQEFSVRGIEIRDFYRDGRKAESLEEAGIIVGECAEDIRIQ